MERREKIPDRGEIPVQRLRNMESLVLTGNHGDLPVGHTRKSKKQVARDEIKSSKIHRDSKDVDRRINAWVIGD